MPTGDRFADAYSLTPAEQVAGAPVDGGLGTQADGFEEVMARFAGCTFDEGLYRLHDAESSAAARKLIETAFPDHVERVLPFGYDWLGSQFCLDDQRREGDEPLVVILEVGTGEVLQVQQTFAGFHDEELVDQAEAAVSRSCFEQWKDHADDDALPLRRDQCVGYRVPLFLSGKDEAENLEVNDLEVYWELTGQALQQTR
jgi:hypothetical protein